MNHHWRERIVDAKSKSTEHWIEGTITVTVSDGQLTITSRSGAVNNKLNYIDVQQIV